MTGPIFFAKPKGRGARSNDVSRFDAIDREDVDDGWARDDDLPPLRTEVSVEVPRSVITRNTSPDISFDRSINPYRGCEHGCVYCFARPSHAYLGLSPGLDFETKLVARPDAPLVLRRELARRSYRPAPIAIGTNTDPYQPIEREYEIMRRILEVLDESRHPVTVVTKGTLIERDVDVLGRMARAGLACVGISVTTLDATLSRQMEPRVPSPQRRLQSIRKLADAGIPVRVMASPLVPGLTDTELEAILEAGKAAGATMASFIPLRLPREVSPLFQEWVAETFPGRADRIMRRVREMHGGRDYDPTWGQRLRGEGVYAEMLQNRFRVAIKRLGFSLTQPKLKTDAFVPPNADPRQARLL